MEREILIYNNFHEGKALNFLFEEKTLNTLKRMEGKNVHIFIKFIINLFCLSHHKTVI